jgi:hypothetical protein
MTLNLTPRLVARLDSIGKLVGETSRVEVVYDALRFYEDVLKRALAGKKIRLSMPGAAVDEDVLSALEERIRLAAEVGLVPRA